MSRNNDKRQLGIDVVSRIDDKIIKDATAERIKMLRRVERASSPLGKFLKYGSAVAAVVVVMVGVMLAVLLMNGKQVPVYNGMTVSNEMPVYSGAKEDAEALIPTFLPTLDITSYRNGQLARSMFDFVGIGLLDKGGIPNANGQGNGRPGQQVGGTVYDSVDMTPGKGEPGVSESLTETEPDDLSPEPVDAIYYARQNEDFYITVHIDNPDRFEILSFTLNDEKYSSYMFEEGSDLEHLVLKCNIGDAEGIVEYTIDAIKYVDGTAIKDVRIRGDKTVKIGVWTEDQPYARFNEKSWQSHSLTLDVQIIDHKGILALSDSHVYAYLYKGDYSTAVSEFVELDPDTPNRIVFYSMEPEKTYRLEIRARYDSFDGMGMSDYVLYSEVGMTAPALVVESVKTENYGELHFGLAWAEDTTERRILSAELLKDKEVVRTLDVADDATEIVVDGLLSNTSYTLRLKYSCNGCEYSLETSAKTRIKQAAQLKIVSAKRDRNSISGSTELDDLLGLASACRVELWLGDVLITTANAPGNFVFDGLAIEKGYTVKYIVEYDADDGKGTVQSVATRRYSYESEGLAYDSNGRISGIGTCTDTVLYLDTEVFRDAFAGNTRITKVYIGENVKKIGVRAFKGCTSLTEVVLPDEMESIGASAFEDCPISELKIPKLSTNFPISAINNTNIKVLVISEGVTVGGYLSVDGGYDKCEELARKLTLISFGSAEMSVEIRGYYIPDDHTIYDSYQLKAINVAGAKGAVWEDGTLYAVYENGERMLIKVKDGTGTFRVPEGVVALCERAFFGTQYSEVVLPETLKNIGEGAFEDCAMLRTVNIPSTVETIPVRAFVSTALTEIIIPEGVTSIGEWAFSNCTKAVRISLPESLRYINYCAFNACTALTEVTIPGGVTRIDNEAFAYCRSLRRVTIGEGVKTLGDAAFNCCESLSEISLPETLTSIGVAALNECRSLERLVIPAGVTSIGEKGVVGRGSGNIVCFKSSKLPSIVRPMDYEKMTFITDFKEFTTDEQGVTYAVTNGGDMIAISYTGTATYVVLPENVTEVTETFKSSINTVYLKSDTLPKGVNPGDSKFVTSFKEFMTDAQGVTYVIKNSGEMYVVSYTGNRTVITLPEGVVEICVRGFAHTSIESVKLPSTLKVIGGAAFEGCEKLYDITLPEGLTVIGEYAFQSCYAIERLLVPQGTTEIGNGAFWGILTVYFEADTLPEGFDPGDSRIVTSVKEIMTDAQGVTYAVLNSGEMIAISYTGTGTSVVLPEGVVEIAANCFENSVKLRNIVLPSTLKRIGVAAFRNCGALKEIEIPEGITTIPIDAFISCGDLRKVKLPSTVKIIERDAFGWCGNLANIEFPDGLEEIGDNAFLECRALRYVIIPGSVKTIGNGTFSACYGITILCSTPVPPAGWETGGWDGRLVLDAICYEIDEQKIVYAIHTDGTKTVLKCEGDVAEVVLPEGVVAIEKWSFEWCDHIKSISLPNTLEYLNDNALSNCKIRELFVPQSVKEVGVQAFGTIPLIRFEASSLPSGMYEDEYPNTVFVFNATK